MMWDWRKKELLVRRGWMGKENLLAVAGFWVVVRRQDGGCVGEG